MRQCVEILDVDAMRWEPLGPAGLYTKLLSRDPDTGARTALQRMDPGEGYAPPTVAHYHHTYEELLGVFGLFSFDARNWVRPKSYLFHPPKTVHGFKSTVPEESWFLSRVGRDLDFNFVPEPQSDDLYPIDGEAPNRKAEALVDPFSDRGVEVFEWGKGDMPIERCLLSVDPDTGEGTALFRIPPGWAAEIAPAVSCDYLEWFVLEGDVTVDGQSMEKHFYTFRPAGSFPKSMSSYKGAILYINFGSPGLG
jgi:hypothetical protein